MRDLDIKAVDLVELHPQIGNAGAVAFPRFQVQQKRVAVGLNRPQFVQIRVKSISDHAAVAHQGCRFCGDGSAQQRCAGRGGVQVRRYAAQQTGRACQALAQKRGALQRLHQTDQLTRTHLAQAQTGADALHIGAAFDARTQALPVGRLRSIRVTYSTFAAQQTNRLQARAGLAAFAPGCEQPAFELAAAHGAHAGIEQGEQRGRVLAAQRLHQLQIAPGAGRQVHQLGIALHLQRGNVGQRPALGVFGIGQQTGAGGVRQLQPLRAPTVQRGDL